MQSKARQGDAKQCRVKQHKAMQSNATQRNVKQRKAMQNQTKCKATRRNDNNTKTHQTRHIQQHKTHLDNP
jgi:hypothetical protein